MFRFFPTCFSQPFLPNPCTLRGLRGAGGTFFMLDQLQPDAEALWAGAPAGSVVACDFYNAGALLPLNDEAGMIMTQDTHHGLYVCCLDFTFVGYLKFQSGSMFILYLLDRFVVPLHVGLIYIFCFQIHNPLC